MAPPGVFKVRSAFMLFCSGKKLNCRVMWPVWLWKTKDQPKMAVSFSLFQTIPKGVTYNKLLWHSQIQRHLDKAKVDGLSLFYDSWSLSWWSFKAGSRIIWSLICSLTGGHADFWLFAGIWLFTFSTHGWVSKTEWRETAKEWKLERERGTWKSYWLMI